MSYILNLGGRAFDLSEPVVMGILNVTPDSFYAGSRKQTAEAIAERTHEIVQEGGRIIDIGACSTRPGGELVDGEEEPRTGDYPCRSARPAYLGRYLPS